MKDHTRLMGATASAALIALAGCGGGSDSSVPTALGPAVTARYLVQCLSQRYQWTDESVGGRQLFGGRTQARPPGEELLVRFGDHHGQPLTYSQGPDLIAIPAQDGSYEVTASTSGSGSLSDSAKSQIYDCAAGGS